MEKLFIVLCFFAAAISIVVCKGDDSYSPAPTPNQMLPTIPSPSPSCSDVIYDMVDCISFLADGGSDEEPTASCCSGFESVLNIDAECVCDAIKSSASLGIELNMTRAAMLPSACGVDSFSIAACDIDAEPSNSAPTPTAPTPTTQPLEPPSMPSTPTSEPPSPPSSDTSPVEAPKSGSHSITASISIVFIIFGLYASFV